MLSKERKKADKRKKQLKFEHDKINKTVYKKVFKKALKIIDGQ